MIRFINLIYNKYHNAISFLKIIKKMEIILLNKFYFLKGFEDIIVFFLFTLDILLFTRIPNLFKRGRPFLKRYTRNFILYSKNIFNIKNIFLKEKNIKGLGSQKINLSRFSPLLIAKICSYLDIASVSSLNLVNKKLHQKTETNIIWYNLYKTYYEKKLIEKEIKLKDLDKITNFKKFCKDVYSIIIYNDKEQMKKYRDRKMGFGRIVIEETIESILRIPNLLLTPWKILSVFFYIINDFFEILFDLINKTTIIFNLVNEEQLSKWENSKYIHDGIYNNYMDYFFDFHIYFFFGLPKFLIYIWCFIGSFILNFILYLIKLFSFAKLCIEDNNFNSHSDKILHKVNSIPFYKVLIQILLGFILNHFHIFILFIPNIYYIYFRFNGFKEINYLSDISYLIQKFYDLNMKEKLQIIFGIYGSGLLIWGISYHYLYLVVEILFNKSEIFFYKIIYQGHCYHFDYLGITSNYLFPLPKLSYYFNMSFIILEYKIKSPFFKKICVSILRIYISFLILIPFLLVFFAFNINNLKESLLMCFLIIIYAVKNLKNIYKVIDNKKNQIDENLPFERCYSTFMALYSAYLYKVIYIN